MARPKYLFSVLNELANTAKQAMTPEQWDKYLAPGRVLRREDVAFPLKADEKKFSPLNQILAESTGKLTPSDLYGRLQAAVHAPPGGTYAPGSIRDPAAFEVRGNRPSYRLGVQDMMSYPNQYQLEGPQFLDPAGDVSSQWESLSLVPGSSYVPGSHFNSRPGLVSWSRLTRRPLAEDPTQASTNIEEIQSDWHRRGRERGYIKNWSDEDLAGFHVVNPDQPGSGWLVVDREGNEIASPPRAFNDTPQDALTLVRRMARNGTLNGLERPPQAPFSDTGYVGLELRKALDSATQLGDPYVTWTTGDQQGLRYSVTPDRLAEIDRTPETMMPSVTPQDVMMLRGMRRYYDQVLPGEADRLARQYGVPGMEVGQTGIVGPGMLPPAVDQALNDLMVNRRNMSIESYERQFEDLQSLLQSTNQTVHSLSLPEDARSKIKRLGLPLFAEGGQVTDQTTQDTNPLDAALGYFQLPIPESFGSALMDEPVRPVNRPAHRPYVPPFFPSQPEAAVPDQPDQPQDVTDVAQTRATAPAPVSPAAPAVPSPQPAPLGATPPAPATPSEAVAYLRALALKESGGDPNAAASTSSALGLHQFTAGTWADVMKQHPELQLTADGRTDPAQSERAARALTEDNATVLSRRGLEPTDANLYVAHFLGASGASRFLTALDSDPHGLATSYVSPGTARANRSIFYDQQGHPRRVAEVYARLTKGFTGRSFAESLRPARTTG